MSATKQRFWIGWSPTFGGGNLLCLQLGQPHGDLSLLLTIRLPWWLAKRMKFVPRSPFHVD